MADVRERTKQLTASVATPEWTIARKVGQGEGGQLFPASNGGRGQVHATKMKMMHT
jgi:hypothetical protein